VANLVKARTSQESEILKSFYDSNCGGTEDDPEKSQYARLLGMAGLGIADPSIVIQDANLWDHVSIWRGIETWTMPTTNREESMNGHLDESTARPNPFWRSMFLLAAMIFRKIRSFRVHALQDFDNEVERSKRRAKKFFKIL
jgi:hypothetical protein